MKESLILIGCFLASLIFFKIFHFFTPEINANLIILLTFSSVFLIFFKKNKVTINKDLIFLKHLFIENLIFILVSLLYALVMISFFNYSIFSYYIDLVSLLFPFFLILNVFLGYLGYKQKDELFFYGDKKINILKFLVKIFFIPFIYGSLFICINKFLIINEFNIKKIDYYFYLFGLTIDVLVALFGYVFTSTWFDNKIESVDDTLKGWFICIICYPPFLYFYQILLSQADNYTWGDWAAGHWYYYPWMCLVILFWLLYWFSHAHFGFKFSNLTWRGLIDEGLYKYFKHPAYLFKNIYWWLYTVPFFGVIGWELVKNIFILFIINMIYYFRAKTEEVHLRKFSEYRAYENRLKNTGIFSILKKSLDGFLK